MPPPRTPLPFSDQLLRKALPMMWLGVDGGGRKPPSPCMTMTSPSSIGWCWAPAITRKWASRMERVLSKASAGTRSSSPHVRRAGAPSVGIGFALCGYGEGADVSRRMDEVVERIAGARPHLLVNDVEAAGPQDWTVRTASPSSPGTGSIALGVCRGESMRGRGWDDELGDEGSGGWLGRRPGERSPVKPMGRRARCPVHTRARKTRYRR